MTKKKKGKSYYVPFVILLVFLFSSVFVVDTLKGMGIAVAMLMLSENAVRVKE